MEKSNLPVSRGALERVLARAAQLQGASSDELDEHGELTEDQVVDLGREVGLSPQFIRQALAEERARPITDERDSGLATRLFGPNRVVAQRMVPGNPMRVLSVLDRWMQRDQWLRVIRQRADMIVWEPRKGFLAGLRRAVGGGDHSLFRATSITATAVEVEAGKTLVRLEADFSSLRDDVTRNTAGGAVLGAATTTAAILMNVMLPVAIAPAVIISAAAFEHSRRTHKHASGRALLTLQLLLDRIERGESEPPSLIRMIESALP